MSPHLISHSCICTPIPEPITCKGIGRLLWFRPIKIHPSFLMLMADQYLNKDGIFSARNKEDQKHLLGKQSVLSASEIKYIDLSDQGHVTAKE